MKRFRMHPAAMHPAATWPPCKRVHPTHRLLSHCAMQVGNVAKWPAQGIDSETQTLINMEWGAFSSSSLPRLPEDEALDAEFPNTGQYWFEKMMSGMYLGDLARRVLLSLAQEVQLFGEQVGMLAGCALLLSCLLCSAAVVEWLQGVLWLREPL